MRRKKLTRQQIDALRSIKEEREAAQRRANQHRKWLLKHRRAQRRRDSERALAEAEALFWRLVEEAEQRTSIMTESRTRKNARRKVERMIALIFDDVFPKK